MKWTRITNSFRGIWNGLCFFLFYVFFLFTIIVNWLKVSFSKTLGELQLPPSDFYGAVKCKGLLPSLTYKILGLLISIKHMWSSSLCLFSMFETLLLYSFPDISKLLSTHENFYYTECFFFFFSSSQHSS